MSIKTDGAAALSIAILISGCTGQAHLSPTNGKPSSSLKMGTSPGGTHVAPESGIDFKAEADVDDRTLKAWRTALSGNSKDALKQIDALDKQYPNFHTVHLMRAQILEHIGRKKEAAEYYGRSVVGDEFDSLKLFKKAEALRTAGDAKASIADYRQVLNDAPQFVPAMTGLAQALSASDPKSPEAKTLLEKAAELSPDDPQVKLLQPSLDAKKAQGVQ